jgi:hypothetical protein
VERRGRGVGVELVDGEAATGVDLARRSRPSSAGQGEAEDEAASCRTWERRRRAAGWEVAVGVGGWRSPAVAGRALEKNGS